MKLVFLVLAGFAVYSGYKFSPVYFTKSQIESSVASAIHSLTHRAGDEGFRRKTVQIASSAGVSIEESDVFVSREQHSGERVIDVSFQYPATVSYLGSERAIQSHVHVREVIHVSESEETRLAEYARINRERDQKQRAQSDRIKRNMDNEMELCEEKHGDGNCQWIEMPAGERSRSNSEEYSEDPEIVRMY